VIAEKMRCGSANLTDTAELGRPLKRVERDARKLRKSDQYFGWVLTATGTHRYAVYDRARVSADQEATASGETEGLADPLLSHRQLNGPPRKPETGC
jgi:hypothetical protein